MNESDFIGVQPYIFGKDFGIKAKEKLDAAAALRTVVNQQPAKGKAGFQAGNPCKFNWGQGVANGTTPALENTERRLETLQHQQRDLPDD